MYSSQGQNFIFKRVDSWVILKVLLSKTNKQLLRINIDTKFGDIQSWRNVTEIVLNKFLC